MKFPDSFKNGGAFGSHSLPTGSGPFFRAWLSFGWQSFGGGATTLALIRRAAVERYGWIDEAEFARYWGLCQIAPGINLLALTVLLGRRVAGAWGILLAMTGLLLPSAVITVLLTAGYAHIEKLPLVRAALRGIIPGTVGLGLMTAFQMARSLLADSGREGKRSVGFSLLLLVGSACAVGTGKLSVMLILAGAGAISALFQWQSHVHAALGEPPP